MSVNDWSITASANGIAPGGIDYLEGQLASTLVNSTIIMYGQAMDLLEAPIGIGRSKTRTLKSGGSTIYENYIGQISHGVEETEKDLICDGRALFIIDYQDLYDVIGGNYGQPDSSRFLLPNLLGRYVRLATDEETLGTTQESAIKEHKHPDTRSEQGGTHTHVQEAFQDVIHSGIEFPKTDNCATCYLGGKVVSGNAESSYNGEHIHKATVDNFGTNISEPQNVRMLPLIRVRS